MNDTDKMIFELLKGLDEKFDKFKVEVKNDFKEVKQKQDYTNSKVAKNTAFRELTEPFFKGRLRSSFVNFLKENGKMIALIIIIIAQMLFGITSDDNKEIAEKLEKLEKMITSEYEFTF
jgi:uncharacterized protein Yka (UPF0111/DUF47 family)